MLGARTAAPPAAAPPARPLHGLTEADLERRFERALEAGDGAAGALCIHESTMRGAMPLTIERSLERLWRRAAATVPDWLPMRHIERLAEIYDIALRFRAPGGRSNIYLVLLDTSDRPQPQGLYVGMSKYAPSARFDQHKAGIRAAGSVLSGVWRCSPAHRICNTSSAPRRRASKSELAQARARPARAGRTLPRQGGRLGDHDDSHRHVRFTFRATRGRDLNLLELPFEHRNWSVGRDFERIRQFNPLGRVPTLVIPDGEALIESAAILDHLDEGRARRARCCRPRGAAPHWRCA